MKQLTKKDYEKLVDRWRDRAIEAESRLNDIRDVLVLLLKDDFEQKHEEEG